MIRINSNLEHSGNLGVRMYGLLMWRPVHCCLIALLLIIFQPGCEDGATKKEVPPAALTLSLVEESVRGLTLMESATLETLSPIKEDFAAAESYIKKHHDYTSYHLLFFLMNKDKDVYRRIDNHIKADILCSALSKLRFLNDWGRLDPKKSWDDIAARALLALGTDAISPLKQILQDETPAPLFGSEDSTISLKYQYRRCDFAYRYLCLLTSVTPQFDPSPIRRDVEITLLKKRLASERR